MQTFFLAVFLLSLTACQSTQQTRIEPVLEVSTSPAQVKGESPTPLPNSLQLLKEEPTVPQVDDLDYCEDSIYAQYLASQYRQEMAPVIAQMPTWRQKSIAKRNLENQVRHHVSRRIEGPHPPYFGGVPVVETPKVEIWLSYFQTKGREVFMKWLVRSHSYREFVVPLLIKEGLPQELFFLAMIESGFNNQAYSRAKATGTWQFMTATARSYGLQINHWVDERRDPIKSTLAAARFLKDLYSQFGDWYLAVAAYNAGPGKIRRAVRKTGSRDFWTIAKSPYIRAETKHYVPKMLAALIIASDPEKFGFHVIPDLRNHTPQSTVEVKRPSRLREISEKLGIDYQLIRRWNPELLRDVTPPLYRTDNHVYELRLPQIFAERFALIEGGLEELEIKDVKYYHIRHGDTLSAIARRHRISLQQIMKMNPNIRPNQLRPGRQIAIPIPAVVTKRPKDTA